MSAAQASWQNLNNFPGTARDDASGIVCNGAGYMGTGFGTGFVYLNDWWKYSFETDTWTPQSSLPAEARQYTAIAGINRDIYLLGGITPSGCTDELWVYHTLYDEWELISHFPGGGRQAPVLCAVNGQLYAGLGRCGSIYYNDWWAFDPGVLTWTQLLSFPGEARFDPIQAALNENVLVGAGISATGAQNDFYGYDPVFSVWKKLNDFPGCGTFYTVHAADQNQLWVCAGADAAYGFCPGFYQYTGGFFADEWKTWDVNALDPVRRGGVGFLFNNRFFYVCGLDSSNNRLNRVQYVETAPVSITGNNDLVIYPSLSTTYICIESGTQLYGTLSVYNASGQPVPVDVSALFSQYARLDVSHLLKGLYIVKVADKEGKVRVGKFVKL